MFLSFKKIIKKCSKSSYFKASLFQTYRCCRDAAELTFYGFNTGFFGKKLLADGVDICFSNEMQFVNRIQHSKFICRYYFLGLYLDKFIYKSFIYVVALIFRDVEFTCGNITISCRHSAGFLIHINCSQIIVFLFGKHGLCSYGSWRNNLYYFSFYNTLGCGRIFHLLTYCNLVSFFYKLCYIAFGRMERDSAHGSPFFLTAVFAGKRQLKFLGC